LSVEIGTYVLELLKKNRDICRFLLTSFLKLKSTNKRKKLLTLYYCGLELCSFKYHKASLSNKKQMYKGEEKEEQENNSLPKKIAREKERQPDKALMD
jgi:hypothetical protein